MLPLLLTPVPVSDRGGELHLDAMGDVSGEAGNTGDIGDDTEVGDSGELHGDSVDIRRCT